MGNADKILVDNANCIFALVYSYARDEFRVDTLENVTKFGLKTAMRRNEAAGNDFVFAAVGNSFEQMEFLATEIRNGRDRGVSI